MKWGDIAAEMAYSGQWIYTLRTKGIQGIERLLFFMKGHPIKMRIREITDIKSY